MFQRHIVPKVFENYFTGNSHKMKTRNNNKSVVIPKVRTETGRKTFSFQGAKVFKVNDLSYIALAYK